MLDIDVQHRDHVTLIEVSGRVDSMTAGEFGESLSSQLDTDHVHIVLDLSQVDYMSSAGLREIVSALKAAKKAKGDVRIANPSGRVREVLEMAGLDTIFLIFTDLESAVNSY